MRKNSRFRKEKGKERMKKNLLNTLNPPKIGEEKPKNGRNEPFTLSDLLGAMGAFTTTPMSILSTHIFVIFF